MGRRCLDTTIEHVPREIRLGRRRWHKEFHVIVGLSFESHYIFTIFLNSSLCGESSREVMLVLSPKKLGLMFEPMYEVTNASP